MFFITLMRLHASIKAIPYVLCSSIPVAMVRILGSKMMSFGLKPTRSTNNLYDRLHISTLRSASAAFLRINLVIKSGIQAIEMFIIPGPTHRMP